MRWKACHARPVFILPGPALKGYAAEQVVGGWYEEAPLPSASWLHVTVARKKKRHYKSVVAHFDGFEYCETVVVLELN